MRYSLLFLATLFSCSSVSAQTFSAPSWTDTSITYSWQNHQRVSDHVYKQANAQRDERPVARPNPARPVNLSFTPSLKRRRETLTKMANEYAAINPKQGPAIKSQLLGNGSGDLIQQMGPALAPFGFRTDNLADAYTTFWITAWEASNGIFNSQTTRAQAQAVKAQVAGALSSLPQIATANDAEKQAFADVLLVQTAMISSNGEHAAANPAILPELKSSVRQVAKKLGVDLDLMTLTPTGFVPAKGR